MKNAIIYGLIVCTLLSTQSAAASNNTDLLSLRDQADVEDDLLMKRLDTVVPALMDEYDRDMWILIAREYNEDPVVNTMLPATWMGARRRMILVFVRGSDGFERFVVSRYPVGDFFETRWNPEEQPDQWQALSDIVAAYDPRSITVNVSDIYGLADGMTVSQLDGLKGALGETLSGRILPDHKLAVGWLETRIPEEMPHYELAVKTAHDIIREGFTGGFIKPGETGRNDLVWWYREKIRAVGLTTWFHPSVAIQRAEATEQDQITMFSAGAEDIIQKGDLLHVDFGIAYMGLHTDTQQHAYVLKDGESDAPDELKAALKTGNRLQDILTDTFKVGKTGNEALKLSRAQAINEGITPSIYTHPIGFHGHAAGATIGMWDKQGGVYGTGDYPIRANAAWSIELSATVKLDMWGGKDVKIMLEEDATFDGESVRYIWPRQVDLHIVK